MSVDIEYVIPLGEDGGEWFVEADESTPESEIRYAILSFLQEIHLAGTDDYLNEIEALALAKLIYSQGWWATGHSEGQFVTDEPAPVEKAGWFVR